MDVVAARMLAQGLTEPLRTADDVVKRLVGVQAQDDWIAPYALRARLVPGAVPAAGDAVVGWFMRGTLHLVAAEDAAWLTGLLGTVQVARMRPRRLQLGLTDEVLRRELAKVRQALPGTRDELLSHVDVPEGQARAHLLAYAGLTGVMVRRGDTYVPMPAGAAPDDPERELALRYLAGYGPAEPQDFAVWSGLTLTTAREAMARAAHGPGETATATTDRAAHKTGETATTRIDRADREPGQDNASTKARTETRATTKSTIGTKTKPKGESVRLLGHLDPYLLGYKDRSFALDPAHIKKVNRGGGFLRPIVLVDGRVAGVWSRAWRRDRMVVTIDAWDPVPQEALNAELAALDATIDR